MKFLVIFSILSASLALSVAAPQSKVSQQVRAPLPRATLEEILEQFQKTWDGIDAAVHTTDDQLKQLLNGRAVLPVVEDLLFNGETIVGIIAQGALDELVANPEGDHHTLIINTLKIVGQIVVRTITDIEAVLKDEPTDINEQVFLILSQLLEECEAQVAPLIELIENGRRK